MRVEKVWRSKSVKNHLCDWSFPPHLQYVAEADICKLWQLGQENEPLTHRNSNTSLIIPARAHRHQISQQDLREEPWVMLLSNANQLVPQELIKSFSHTRNTQLSRVWLAECIRKNRTVTICNCFKEGKFPHKNRSVVNARMN